MFGSFWKLVTNSDGRPEPSTSPTATPMPAMNRPFGIRAQPCSSPTSSNRPPPLLWNRNAGLKSLAT
jgi:hypothetical protein